MMDQRGPNWCEKNTDTIVGWMQEEAKRRRLPFVGYVAKLLVRRAIKLTRMEVEGDPGGR